MKKIKRVCRRIAYGTASKNPPRKRFTLPADFVCPTSETDSLLNADANGMVIHGCDYTNAEFVEIDEEYKENVIPTLQKVNVISLYILTRRTGPGGKYRGIGWCDLFAGRTELDKFLWPSIRKVCNAALETPMNEDCMYRVWFCPPGLVHIEVDDDGTWSVHDILDLPLWMLIG